MQPLRSNNPLKPDGLPAPLAGDDASPMPARPRFDSHALFGDATVVMIDHEGETYALRRTRLGKLILTK
ncbi:MAG: hemin uptake protein HemP [Betaproteobacteria bacterium]|nr:hemin uptake protein HemP [Betaproteobacteria bacterium]